jgi:hypothetical protein
MNVYRKSYSNKLTFTQNGPIETPRNARHAGNTLMGWLVDAVVHIGLIAGGLVTVYMLIIR